LLIPVSSLTPPATPTRTPTPRDLTQLALQPIPAQFFNKILFQSGARQAPLIWAIDPDGSNLALVTDRAVYDRAVARDVISPDGAFLLYNAPSIDFPDALQIWIQYQGRPAIPAQRLTWIRAGVAYAPAWAPYGNKFAYVSSETGRDEIWLFDLETKRTQKLTSSPDWYWNQYPSWSPDGKRIVFSSDRGHIGSFTEIWTMNPDGTGEIKLGDGTRDAWAPVWIKWKQ
jgi:Tol biopolymer transport system component